MKLVKTDEARPGQKAARDVTDLRGNLLFKAGTELTAELLETCKQRTISHLFIEDAGGDAPKTPVDLQAQREAVQKEIDRMFAGTESSATMAALKEASKRFLTSKLAK
ncbi:MAG TPA: hypothetical protein VE981_16735 [Planctomycetota bacterium]|nr:hypothetical protein [Planctomycetota bacterium]